MSSYTIQSEKLNPNKAFILQKSELEKRFDPQYYAHFFNEYEKKLIKKPHKKFLQLLKSINNGYDFRDYKDSGTPYLKVANIKQGEFDFSKIQYIDFNSEEISKNIQLKKGNILLTRKGTFGNAIALNEDYDYVISSEVFYIELQENSINPKFLEIFFNSKIGQAQFDKNKIGAIMGSLSQEAIRDLLIPLPSDEIQTQIVSIYNKYINQKEQNDANAEKLIASIDEYLLNELGIVLPTTSHSNIKQRMFIKPLNKLTGNRFDPFYYDSYFDKIEASIKSSKYETITIGAISLRLDTGKTPAKSLYADEETPNKIKIIKAGSYTSDFIDISKCDYTFPDYNGNEVFQGDIFILSAAHQAEYVGKKVYYLKEEPSEKIFFVGELVRISTNENLYNNQLLFSLLKSELFTKLLNREKRGQTSHLYPNDVKKIIIPFPPLNKQLEIANHISALRQQAQQFKENTNNVLAKVNVEIEKLLLGE